MATKFKLACQKFNGAVMKGNVEGVVAALYPGPKQVMADINQRKGQSQKTALHTAVSNIDFKVVFVLMGHPNIDPNVVNRKNVAALEAAYLQFLEVRGEGLELYRDHPYCRALLVIIRLIAGHPKTDVEAYQAGAERGRTILADAACRGHMDVVQILLRHPGIHVNHKKIDGGTPLHSQRFAQNRKEIRALLLQHPNIDINSVNNDGCTAFLDLVVHPNRFFGRLCPIHEMRMFMTWPQIDKARGHRGSRRRGRRGVWLRRWRRVRTREL